MLIVDGHDSHNFLELIDVAIENNVHIIELPAHTSHWLQPCDRTVFGPFKNAYRKACEDLSSSFPGSVVSKANFCGLLKKAWQEAVTPSNIHSGFRACGIYPFNPKSIPSEAYIPNSLYAAGDAIDNEDRSADTDLVTASFDVTTASDARTEVESQLLGCSNPCSSHASETTDGTHTTEVISLSSNSANDPQVISATPELALSLFESSLSVEQLECFKFCFSKCYDLASDELYMTWKNLKVLLERGPTLTVECLPDVSSVSLQSDADVTVISDSVLPQLDISMTDLLANSLDQLEESSTHQDTTAEAQQQHELQVNSCEQKRFPFSNSSHPGDSDADVLPYPAQIRRKPKKHTKKFFILTSKEARAAKLQEITDKLNRETSKKASSRKRKEKMEKIPNDKKPKDAAQLKTKQRRRKQNRKQKENQKSADTVPCSVCSIRFCDDTSGREWIQCQECELWYHNECQGLDEMGIATFICIQCDE